MNKIMLIGNLTRDPESATTQSGVGFTRFTIAVNRPFTNSAGERVADYFNVICWRELGERCAKYLFKGSKVGVSGMVQQRQYEDRDGIKRTAFDVVANEVEFLTPRANAQQQSGEAPQTVAPRVDARGGGIELTPVDDLEDLPF